MWDPELVRGRWPPVCQHGYTENEKGGKLVRSYSVGEKKERRGKGRQKERMRERKEKERKRNQKGIDSRLFFSSLSPGKKIMSLDLQRTTRLRNAEVSLNRRVRREESPRRKICRERKIEIGATFFFSVQLTVSDEGGMRRRKRR